MALHLDCPPAGRERGPAVTEGWLRTPPEALIAHQRGRRLVSAGWQGAAQIAVSAVVAVSWLVCVWTAHRKSGDKLISWGGQQRPFGNGEPQNGAILGVLVQRQIPLVGIAPTNR